MEDKKIMPLLAKTQTYREVSAPIVAEVVRRVGLADRKALREVLREAYPFGEREHWPYKAWLMEIKAQTGGLRNQRRESSQFNLFHAHQ